MKFIHLNLKNKMNLLHVKSYISKSKSFCRKTLWNPVCICIFAVCSIFHPLIYYQIRRLRIQLNLCKLGNIQLGCYLPMIIWQTENLICSQRLLILDTRTLQHICVLLLSQPPWCQLRKIILFDDNYLSLQRLELMLVEVYGSCMILWPHLM